MLQMWFIGSERKKPSPWKKEVQISGITYKFFIVLRPSQDQSLWISKSCHQNYDRAAPRTCRIMQISHYGVMSHRTHKCKMRWETREGSTELFKLHEWLHMGGEGEGQMLKGLGQNDSTAKGQNSLPTVSVPDSSLLTSKNVATITGWGSSICGKM